MILVWIFILCNVEGALANAPYKKLHFFLNLMTLVERRITLVLSLKKIRYNKRKYFKEKEMNTLYKRNIPWHAAINQK